MPQVIDRMRLAALEQLGDAEIYANIAVYHARKDRREAPWYPVWDHIMRSLGGIHKRNRSMTVPLICPQYPVTFIHEDDDEGDPIDDSNSMIERSPASSGHDSDYQNLETISYAADSIPVASDDINDAADQHSPSSDDLRIDAPLCPSPNPNRARTVNTNKPNFISIPHSEDLNPGSDDLRIDATPCPTPSFNRTRTLFNNPLTTPARTVHHHPISSNPAFPLRLSFVTNPATPIAHAVSSNVQGSSRSKSGNSVSPLPPSSPPRPEDWDEQSPTQPRERIYEQTPTPADRYELAAAPTVDRIPAPKPCPYPSKDDEEKVKRTNRLRSTRIPDHLRRIFKVWETGCIDIFDLIIEVKKLALIDNIGCLGKLTLQVIAQTEHIFQEDSNVSSIGAIFAIGHFWRYQEYHRMPDSENASVKALQRDGSYVPSDPHSSSSASGYRNSEPTPKPNETSSSATSSVPSATDLPLLQDSPLGKFFSETEWMSLIDPKSDELLPLVAERLKQLNPAFWSDAPMNIRVTSPSPSQGDNEQDDQDSMMAEEVGTPDSSSNANTIMAHDAVMEDSSDHDETSDQDMDSDEEDDEENHSDDSDEFESEEET